METDYTDSKVLKLSSTDIKKLLDDREKAKQYIKSCKEIISKQSEHLKAQQQSFKESLSSLESQQYNSRFHAVGIKLELESHKIYMTFYKKYKLMLASGFFKFRFQLGYKTQAKKYIPIELKSALRYMCAYILNNHQVSVQNAWKKFKTLINGNTEKIVQEAAKIEKENKDLKFKIAKSKARTETNSHVQDLLEENKVLKDKIQSSEESVELFVKEMSNLLDKHEPPGFREEIEKLTQKNKRTGRLASKSKSKNSPDRLDAPRKSFDR
jgi:uncharacterized protein YdcH (DUF465 family)